MVLARDRLASDAAARVAASADDGRDPVLHEGASLTEWMTGPRFAGIARLHTPRQVAEQRGTIPTDYPVARDAAVRLHARLRELFDEGRAITTFGPYSPGQAVAMKRAGIEGIYLGGWATSAKGSSSEDPGPDLASYPLSQVPDEAAGIVRALLTADRNQRFARARMSAAERQATREVDFTPLIIADADTGHGGDGHVRNLVRRFVEVGVPGYHIEDQRPGTKKCGHQGGKVLVPVDEQIKRLNAARLQLDIMGVAGLVVARTDAEAATLIDGSGDERDQPFILGVTNPRIPPYRAALLATHRRLHRAGVAEAAGHLLYAMADADYDAADAWLQRTGMGDLIDATVEEMRTGEIGSGDEVIDRVTNGLVETWEADAGLATLGEALADALEQRRREGAEDEETPWRTDAGWRELRKRATQLGVQLHWDAESARTPEGYYQVRGGIPYAIARSLAVAPFADLLWMETKTADLADAREFAEAVHAVHPDKMLAYNLSPSFNWDTTGMSDEEMRRFPSELGRLGFVFNFITYGGHQIDGLAAEEFSTALRDDGMLALARLQRKLRLLESPYRTPQTLVGGPRADAALLAASGQTATTRAMGAGSTQVQHLAQTEVPTRVLGGWLERWAEHHDVRPPQVTLRPYTAGSDVLELAVGNDDAVLASIVFAPIEDRRGRPILSIRDQHTHDRRLRRKRLMTLMHLFLMHRYEAASVHYLTPTDDNRRQCDRMRARGLFASVSEEVGDIIVAEVDRSTVQSLVAEDAGIDDLIETETGPTAVTAGA